MPTEKPFVFTKTFDQEGTFQALYAAQNWLRENGYSYGSTCRDEPIGVMKGEWDIAKWRNLSRQDVAGLDGVLLGSPRNGPMELKLKEIPA
ncbi:hypothetical protein [Pseudomonas mosselii]|uniref:hypothetical protein n=1 Tax=Pseudomonas mosselii TaxID=78327 RepID=UPI003F328C0F